MAKKISYIKVGLNFLLKYYCSIVLMGTEFILGLQDTFFFDLINLEIPFFSELTSMVINPFVRPSIY